MNGRTQETALKISSGTGNLGVEEAVPAVCKNHLINAQAPGARG